MIKFANVCPQRFKLYRPYFLRTWFANRNFPPDNPIFPSHKAKTTQTGRVKMVEKIERYAKENGATGAGVLIESLDSFLRKPK